MTPTKAKRKQEETVEAGSPPTVIDAGEPVAPDGSAQTQAVDPEIARIAKLLGLRTDELPESVISGVKQALEYRTKAWDDTRKRVEMAVQEHVIPALMDYKGYTSLTITIMLDGTTSVVQHTGARRGGGTGSGNTSNHPGLRAVVLTPELASEYGLSETTYRSRRALSHVLALAKGDAIPADNATHTYIKRAAPKIAALHREWFPYP